MLPLHHPALPRQFNVMIYKFNANLNEYKVANSVSDRPICLPKHKEMFSKEKFNFEIVETSSLLMKISVYISTL